MFSRRSVRCSLLVLETARRSSDFVRYKRSEQWYRLLRVTLLLGLDSAITECVMSRILGGGSRANLVHTCSVNVRRFACLTRRGVTQGEPSLLLYSSGA